MWEGQRKPTEARAMPVSFTFLSGGEASTHCFPGPPGLTCSISYCRDTEEVEGGQGNQRSL